MKDFGARANNAGKYLARVLVFENQRVIDDLPQILPFRRLDQR
jgi:hypothetical protein